MRTSRKLLIGGAAVVALLLLAVLALPFLIDVNRFRPLIQSQLQQQLHRPVTLGEMGLKVIPLSIRIADVVIGQPEGYSSPQPFLGAKEVFVSVSLFPLLRGDVSVKAIDLKSPRIELVHNAAGAWNYEIAGANSAPSGGGSGGGNFTLDELKVEDGEVAINDQKAGTPRDVYEHIDLTLKNLGAGRTGSVTGTVRLDTVAAVVSIQSDFQIGDPFSAKGTLTMKSDNNQDPLEVAYDVRGGNVVTINSLTAKLGALSAAVAGTIDTGKNPPALQITVKTPDAPIADLIRIAALYGAKLPADLKADGMLRADVKITGTTAKPMLAGQIHATQAQVTAKDLVEPVRSSELEIDLTPDTLTTKQFTIETGATKLTAQATVNDYSGDSPKVNATLQTNGAKVEELLRIASAYGQKPPGLNGSGTLSVDMKVTMAGKALNYSGSGSLRNVSLTSPDLPKTLSIPTADIKFTDDRLGLDHLQAQIGSMHLDGSASIRDFDKPKIQFDARVDQLNVAEVTQMAGGGDSGSTSNAGGKSAPATKKKAAGPNPIKQITANGTVAIGKIIYQQITLTNVKATVSLVNGLFKLDPLTAGIFGGQETGSITADLGAATPAYTVKMKIANVDANQLLAASTPVKNVLTGAISGGMDVQFLSKANEDIAKSLNGKVQIQMGQGRISGVQILNEVANVGKFLGYTKKSEVFTNIVKLTGSLNIQNGLATTNDLFMDLGGGTLSGAGTMGLVDQTLKMKITTVLGKDFAQKNAPGQIAGLLSTVLANQQGELVVPMMVTGTFDKPKFGPDGEQFAAMKLKGLLPTAGNPAALTSGVKGIVDAFTGKSNDSKSGDKVQDGIINLFDQFRKKKDDKKQ